MAPIPTHVVRTGVADDVLQEEVVGSITAPIYSAPIVSIAALRALNVTTPALANGASIQVQGYYAANDGGGGVYVWNSTSMATDNGGTVIQATGVATGRWIFQGKPNVRTFGAYGDGTHDDITAIKNAITYAQTAGISIYFPAGTYLHSDTLTVTGVSLYGDGPESILRASDQTKSVVYLTGTNPSVRSMAITSVSSSRQLTGTSDGVGVTVATGFAIQNCVFNGQARFAIYVEKSTQGVISGNRISGTLADGVHMTDNVYYATVSANSIYSTGDDAISVFGYNTQTNPCKNIAIVGNALQGGATRGIAIQGADDVTVSGNTVADFIHAAGIVIGYDSTFGSYGCNRLVVTGNVFRNCGSASPVNATVQLNASNTYKVTGLSLINNGFYSSNWEFMQFTGSGFQNVRINENTFDTNAVTSAVELQGINNVTIRNNTFRSIATYGITVPNTCSGSCDITGNLFVDIDTAASPSANVIHFSNGGTWTSIRIDENDLQQPGGTVPQRFVENLTGASAPLFTLRDNIGASLTTYGFSVQNVTHSNSATMIMPRITFASAAPTGAPPDGGTWNVGDIVFNSSPATNYPSYYECVTAGVPGTWKGSANLQ